MINAIGRKHWWTKVKEIQEWEKIIYFQTLGKLPKEPLKKARLVLTRHSSRAPDYDNLAISFKHIVDSLRKAKIIKNDSMDVIGKPEYNWVKCKNGQGFVEIEVYAECEEDNEKARDGLAKESAD